MSYHQGIEEFQFFPRKLFLPPKFFRIGERALASGFSSDKSGVLKDIESLF